LAIASFAFSTMPPSFHPRVDTKDDLFEGISNHKVGVLHTTPLGTVTLLDAPSLWPTMASLQWFQCIQSQWKNSPRTPVQPILPFSDFHEENVDNKSEALTGSAANTTTPDANGTNEKRLEESRVEEEDKDDRFSERFHLDHLIPESQLDEIPVISTDCTVHSSLDVLDLHCIAQEPMETNLKATRLEEDEKESICRSELCIMDHFNPDSPPNGTHHDTSTDYTVDISFDMIRGDAALNVTTSTGSSLQEQIECLHLSMDESKERLRHTQTQLEEHIERLKSRQLRNRDAEHVMLRYFAATKTQTVQGLPSPRANGGAMFLTTAGTEEGTRDTA
jgi:hypothetical protein